MPLVAVVALMLTVASGCGRGAKDDAQGSPAASPSESGFASSAKSTAAAKQLVGGEDDLTTDPNVDATTLSDALFGNIPDEELRVGEAKPAPSGVRGDLLQLPSELPVPRLIDFLRTVDIEMQNVASGRTKMQTHADATQEMNRLATLKLQASTRLVEIAAAESQEQVTGLRGKLQSLSHLAALGDLASAEQLETLAKEQSRSNIASLVLDCQLVLVGLAMERMQNGSSKDSHEILDLIRQIAQAPQTPDVSALMVMGQAHAVLQQYGDEAAAEKVRETIIDLFADHPNENVSAMAIGLAGSPKFANVDETLRKFGRGETIDSNQWRDVIDGLLETSADVTTIQYLAGAALQFEAAGNEPLADATFEAIAESEQVVGRSADELAVAVEARRARRVAVGETFAFAGPSVDGRPLSIESYAGRVVLMPFWAIAIPESLTILQSLDRIRGQADGRVEIVGMNLDAQEAPADEFLQQSPVEFRSFQSVTSASGANEIAKQFGVVSLPFVVIIDPSGKVAAVNLSGRGLSEQVAKVMGQ